MCVEETVQPVGSYVRFRKLRSRTANFGPFSIWSQWPVSGKISKRALGMCFAKYSPDANGTTRSLRVHREGRFQKHET